MSSATDVFLHVVCPSLGTVMASVMFAAPIPSLRKAISRGSLGDLNPTPWAFMTGNCLGWISYAVAKQDLFVLFSNAPGLVLSIWLNMGAAKLQYQEMYRAYYVGSGNSHSLQLHVHEDVDGECFEEDGDGAAVDSRRRGSADSDISFPSFTRHEKWVIRVITTWVLVLSIVCFVPMSPAKQADVIGLVVNINLVIFYGAPLSTILEVLKTRNSSSIHRRTMVMSLLNSFFWLAYGMAIKDMVIFFPNASGFLLGFIQLILCVVFSDKTEIDTNAGEQLMNNDNEEENSPIENEDVEII